MRIRKKHSRTALMTAAVSLTTFGAHAQQAEPLEEVVVTGFRASLANALENKRESNQIIESVSAEDIGKFPDQNVAESLQRLSGVQIDRDNGQGTKVRIRGLDQNVVLLNDDTEVLTSEWLQELASLAVRADVGEDELLQLLK